MSTRLKIAQNIHMYLRKIYGRKNRSQRIFSQMSINALKLYLHITNVTLFYSILGPETDYNEISRCENLNKKIKVYETSSPTYVNPLINFLSRLTISKVLFILTYGLEPDLLSNVYLQFSFKMPIKFWDQHIFINRAQFYSISWMFFFLTGRFSRFSKKHLT